MLNSVVIGKFDGFETLGIFCKLPLKKKRQYSTISHSNSKEMKPFLL